MGPPWLRTDPKVREAQDTQASLSPPTGPEPPPPWQVPSEKPGNIQPQIFPAGGEKSGGFPIVIFVILILAIIAAVAAYFIIK
jgi:hypothetical protein